MRKVWIGPLGLILLGPLLFLAADTAGGTLNVATTGSALTLTNATIEVVVPGANFPVALAFAPDGRLFYTEHCTGDIRIVAADDQLMAQPFANVEVPVCGDWGLTGLALDPDFESNHYVYVHYMEEVTSDPLVSLSRSSSTCRKHLRERSPIDSTVSCRFRFGRPATEM